MKLLHSRWYLANQSWFYEAVWAVQNRVVRVNVRRNVYDSQSHEHLFLFDGDKWNLLMARPLNGVRFKPVSYVHETLTPVQKSLFTATEAELIAEAVDILMEHPPA